METKDVITALRIQKGMTQAELAQAVFVTRQAVSRWETGETVPNIETLKLLSGAFQVSINTLLGSPRKLFCQCCGMPLEDGILSREADGSINEDYCQWCYTGGRFTYPSLESLVDYLIAHFKDPDTPEAQARETYRAQLSALGHWKREA